MSAARPRLRVVRFHLGEQEAALPADAVVDVDEPRVEHPHLAHLLGQPHREDDAGARTLLLRCPGREPVALRVDGPVHFGHLEPDAVIDIPRALGAALGGLVVGLWRRGDSEDGALGWRLALEEVCARVPGAPAGAGAGAATVVGSEEGGAEAAGDP